MNNLGSVPRHNRGHARDCIRCGTARPPVRMLPLRVLPPRPPHVWQVVVALARQPWHLLLPLPWDRSGTPHTCKSCSAASVCQCRTIPRTLALYQACVHTVHPIAQRLLVRRRKSILRRSRRCNAPRRPSSRSKRRNHSQLCHPGWVCSLEPALQAPSHGASRACFFVDASHVFVCCRRRAPRHARIALVPVRTARVALVRCGWRGQVTCTQLANAARIHDGASPGRNGRTECFREALLEYPWGRASRQRIAHTVPAVANTQATVHRLPRPS